MEELLLTFIDFVRGQRCAVCNTSPVDPDHHPTRGAGGTDDRVWPLCRIHHTERHMIGIKTFERKYGVQVDLVIDELWVQYKREVDVDGVCGHHK